MPSLIVFRPANSSNRMVTVKSARPGKNKAAVSKGHKNTPGKSSGKTKAVVKQKKVSDAKRKPAKTPAKKAAAKKVVSVKKTPNKSASGNSVKKVVPTKKVAEKKIVVHPKASVGSAVKKVAAAKVLNKTSPHVAKDQVAKTTEVKSKSVKQVEKAAPVKKSVVPKTKETPVQKTVASVSNIVPNKDVDVKKPVSVKKGSGPAAKPETGKAKEGSAKNKSSETAKPIVKQDPLDAKAAKAIREMEETMDLSRMRSRIQAGTQPQKLVHRQQAPLLKLVEPTNTTKVKFQLEFEFRASPKILFNYLSDSSGLAGWFADDVRTKDAIYTFVWEGSESYARLIGLKDLQLVRFQWSDETDGTYFQFEIKEDDITSDVALIITDFANPAEKETNMRLWESQVQKLRMLLGSF